MKKLLVTVLLATIPSADAEWWQALLKHPSIQKLCTMWAATSNKNQRKSILPPPAESAVKEQLFTKKFKVYSEVEPDITGLSLTQDFPGNLTITAHSGNLFVVTALAKGLHKEAVEKVGYDIKKVDKSYILTASYTKDIPEKTASSAISFLGFFSWWKKKNTPSLPNESLDITIQIPARYNSLKLQLKKGDFSLNGKDEHAKELLKANCICDIEVEGNINIQNVAGALSLKTPNKGSIEITHATNSIKATACNDITVSEWTLPDRSNTVNNLTNISGTIKANIPRNTQVYFPIKKRSTTYNGTLPRQSPFLKGIEPTHTLTIDTQKGSIILD